MRGAPLARRRALTALACAALAAAVAGCTAPAGSTVTVAGKTLTVYAAAPPGGGDQAAQDVVAAEQLALQKTGSKVGNYTVRLVDLRGKKVSDNARTAIQDSSAIAYLGEVVPGQSADSIGITNAQGLLEVSPTDTAVALTQTTTAVPNSPTLYYEALKTYSRTFARVVPTSALEAKALVSEMQGRGVKSVYVAGDGSDYGKALGVAMTNAAASASITVQRTASGADAVFYAGGSAPAAAALLNQVAASNPAVKLFAPSALADQAFVSALSPGAARRVEISSPGFFGNLPATALAQFVAPFRAAFGHTPAPQAIFGYEAMSALLAVLSEAGSAANNRATVVHDFFAIKNRQSVLGPYSIDVRGDTSLGAFVLSRVAGGRLMPFKAIQAQG